MDGEGFDIFSKKSQARGRIFAPFVFFGLFCALLLSSCKSENEGPANSVSVSRSGISSSSNSSSGSVNSPSVSSNNSPNLTSPTHKGAWKMQDVSVLFPIPISLPNPSAIHPSQVGTIGALVPSSLLAKLPLLEQTLSIGTQTSQLELVSVRFDPPEQQIRLIWQIFKSVVNPDGSTSIVAYDTAVHTFYQINDTNAFIADLSAVDILSENDYTTQTALTVHPTLVKQGMKGAYAQALNQLLFKYCGEETIFRLTFMQASGEHLHWTFGGFTYAEGVINNFLIPKVNINTTQTFTNSSPSAGDFMGGIDIVPAGQNEFDGIITNSTSTTNTSSNQLELAHFTAVTLENPIISPTTATDCASCHVAQMEKLWIEDRQPDTIAESANVFTASEFNLTNPSPDINRSDNLRAFGYFAGTPSVSQRTIHESALVAEQLNQGVVTTQIKAALATNKN